MEQPSKFYIPAGWTTLELVNQHIFLGYLVMNSNLSLSLMNKFETMQTNLNANTWVIQNSRMVWELHGMHAQATLCK